MKKSSGTNPGQTSGGEKVQTKEGGIKVTITDSTERVIAAFTLRPRKFRSGALGQWGSMKKIDWETRKYYQIQTYMIEIGSKNQKEPIAEPASEPAKQ
jgi:hypothetical protein